MGYSTCDCKELDTTEVTNTFIMEMRKPRLRTSLLQGQQLQSWGNDHTAHRNSDSAQVPLRGCPWGSRKDRYASSFPSQNPHLCHFLLRCPKSGMRNS